MKIKILFFAFLYSFLATLSYAAETAGSPRNDMIKITLNGMSGTDAKAGAQSTELEPIRVKVKQAFRENEFLLARALYLYNQRRLSEAKGDFKEVLLTEPANAAAVNYLTEIIKKNDASKKPKDVLEAEIKGIASVEKSQMGGNYGKEEFGDTDGGERFTTNTSVVSAKMNKTTPDWHNTFIAEGLKLEGTMGDYKYTATANLNYYNKNSSRREDWRINSATWWMQNEKLQFMVGDSSSYLSRYILNGVNYRGANLQMHLYQSMLGDIRDNMKVLYGKVPYYWLTEDEYIYPREIIGVRNEMDLGRYWELNATFAYIWDNDSRMKKVDSLDKAKRNGIIGIDQVFRILPGIWTVSQESAFSYCDDDITSDVKILRSNANYLVSDLKTKTVKLYNSYERIDPNFRSYSGLNTYFANKQITINREHWLNSFDFAPYDEVDFGLQYSKTRSNLDKSYDTETIEENNYKANLKVMPKNALPTFTLRGSIWTSSSTPGPVGAPREESNWDGVFEMQKKLWDTDWSAAYGIRGYAQYLQEMSEYGNARGQSFTLSANRSFFENRLTLTPSYTFAYTHLTKKPVGRLYTTNTTNNLFDLNAAYRFWDTAVVTFDYNYSDNENFATPSLWGSNNAFTTTLSWPFTTTLGYRRKLVFSPYLSYHYSDGKSVFLDRRYWAGRLEGDYFLTENSKFNLSGEYRDNAVSDPAYLGLGDEYRIMLSYKTVNGF